MKAGRLLALWLGLVSPLCAEVTVDAVIDRSGKNASKPELLAFVRSRTTPYELSPQDIIRMREAGVDPDVIVAMIEHRPPPSSEPEKHAAPAPSSPPLALPDSPGRAVPDDPPAASPARENLRIENRSRATLFVTLSAGRVLLSHDSGELRISPEHYLLLGRDPGDARLVVAGETEGESIRCLEDSDTRIVYQGPDSYLVAEGLDRALARRSIRGLAPGSDLSGITSRGFADRILVIRGSLVEEYRGEALSIRSSGRDEGTWKTDSSVLPPPEDLGGNGPDLSEWERAAWEAYEQARVAGYQGPPPSAYQGPAPSCHPDGSVVPPSYSWPRPTPFQRGAWRHDGARGGCR
ncbi:MAG: hypothetical protein HY720_25555 [Planctomycetes bacterium]|nr:hypothetical protein [Planctomycetota bacterium]